MVFEAIQIDLFEVFRRVKPLSLFDAERPETSLGGTLRRDRFESPRIPSTAFRQRLCRFRPQRSPGRVPRARFLHAVAAPLSKDRTFGPLAGLSRARTVSVACPARSRLPMGGCGGSQSSAG